MSPIRGALADFALDRGRGDRVDRRNGGRAHDMMQRRRVPGPSCGPAALAGGDSWLVSRAGGALQERNQVTRPRCRLVLT